MTNTISNIDDTIDSRDVIERLEELRSEREALVTAIDDVVESASETNDPRHALLLAEDALTAWDESEEGRELEMLEELDKDGANYSGDWKYGAQLIRDSYFEDYARELAEDIGAIPNDAAWPCTCIDWEQAARELQMDYTSIEFGDVTYWVR